MKLLVPCPVYLKKVCYVFEEWTQCGECGKRNWQDVWKKFSQQKADMSFFISFRPRLNRAHILSMRKMANQQNVNPNTIKTTVSIDLWLNHLPRPKGTYWLWFRSQNTEEKHKSFALTQDECWRFKHFLWWGNTYSRCHSSVSILTDSLLNQQTVSRQLLQKAYSPDHSPGCHDPLMERRCHPKFSCMGIE